jgi:hypothetical protein
MTRADVIAQLESEARDVIGPQKERIEGKIAAHKADLALLAKEHQWVGQRWSDLMTAAALLKELEKKP